MADEVDDIDGKTPLTELERKKIRRIIQDQDRMNWLWGTLRIWGSWVSGAIVGTWAVYEVGWKFLKAKGWI